jgi:ElaB/YqjD/DUF883 family membrane-anchored ribosome-binding protein
MTPETTVNVGTARAQLVEDFQRVVSDGEALLRAMASVPGEKVTAIRTSVEERLALSKERLRELQGAAVEKTTAAARAADQYVHQNPWPLIGAAAAVGVVIGLTIAADRR